MANELTANGLTLSTLQQVIDQIKNGTATYPGFFQIYGPSINVEPNSPDGQLINLIAQVAIDLEELAAQINAGFDPDQAVGRVLDMRCAINGVVRRAGTYTQQPITVTVDRPVTLSGLDTAPASAFTVSDSSGNRFKLLNTYSFGGAGSVSLAFQAETMGAVLTTPNTINQVVTVILGVTAVNNPSAATSVGTPEETDTALRIRRQNSVALPSRGYLDGLLGALLNVDGVTQAIVRENDTNATVDGIPAHSIWCIVLGGTNADVADAIYRKRNAGCGMKGATSVTITQVDGTPFSVEFDRPTNQNLWISFNATAVTGSLDANYIRTQLLARLSYNIGQAADSSAIVALCKEIAPNISFSNEGVSDDNVTYVTLLDPTDINYQFQIASTRIIINGTPGT